MKNCRFNYLCLCSALVCFATVASADSLLFDFSSAPSSTTNDYGNSIALTQGGVTVTATAWSVPDVNPNTQFAVAALDNYNGTNLGLGVCSPNDPLGQNCDVPYHQVDNLNGDELVLFAFSTPVNLSSITITNYIALNLSTAVDLTYYVLSNGLTTSSTVASLGTGTTVNGDCGSGCPITDSLSGNNVTYLAVAASVPDAGSLTDSFKIESLSVSDVPEPGTLGLLLLPLAGLAIASRRKAARRAPVA